MPVAFGLWHHV